MKHGEIWYKQPKETPRAYELFCIYRDLGPTRTLTATANKDGRAFIPNLSAFAKKFDWVIRADAYDRSLCPDWDEKVKASIEEKLINKKIDDISAVDSLIKKGIQKLEAMNYNELKPKEVLDYLDRAIRLKREILGQDVKKIDVTTGGLTLETLFNSAINEGYIKQEDLKKIKKENKFEDVDSHCSLDEDELSVEENTDGE